MSSEEFERLLAERRASIRRLEMLLESEVWKRDLLPAIVAQLRSRRISAFGTQIRALDDAFQMASLQSEAAGIQFVIGLPEIIIDDLRADIERMLAEREEK